MTPRHLIALAATLAAASPALAQDSATTYLAKAGASDMYERESAQLALQKSSDQRVKSFAQMMLKDHTQSTAELTSTAAKAGVTVPTPVLTPAQQEMLTTLQPLSGAAFDKAYLDQQRQAHAMALTLHQSYATGGDRPELRQVAAKVVPVVQHHIAALEGDRTASAHGSGAAHP